MKDCKLEDCKLNSTHPLCQRCYPVRAHCRTCGKTFDFPVGDPDRGDLYVREALPESWYCHHCGAREMGRMDKRITVGKQATLEALFG